MGTAAFGLPWFYLTFGVIGGIGCGLVSIVGTTTIMRTQTQKFGFGAGTAALGFGLGTLLYGAMVRATPQFGEVSAASATIQAAEDYASQNGLDLPAAASTMDPGQIYTLLSIFMVSGVAIAAYGFVFALLLHKPAERSATIADRPVKEVLLSMQWWFLWLIAFIATIGGCGLIAASLGMLRDISGLTVAQSTSYLSILALSACIGRVAGGLLGERVGYRRMTSFFLVLQAGLYMGLAASRSIVSALLIFGLAYFCFGALVAVLGGWTAQSFGTRRYGPIWGLLATGFGTAGLLGPWFLSNVREIGGSYGAALMPIGIMLSVCALLPAMMHERGAQADHRTLHEAKAA